MKRNKPRSPFSRRKQNLQEWDVISCPKNEKNKFAVPVIMSGGFVFYLSVLMILGISFFAWMLYATINNLFVEGALLDALHRFFTLDSHSRLAVFLTPIFLMTPVLMLFLLIYVLRKSWGGYFFNNHFYIVFSHRGIAMAGHFTSWSNLIWIGGKRTIFGKGILFCWATERSGDKRVCFEIPSIRPFTEHYFYALCEKIKESFPEETKHLDSKSWRVIDLVDVGGMAFKHTLIPWYSNPQDALHSSCSSVFQPPENEEPNCAG